MELVSSRRNVKLLIKGRLLNNIVEVGANNYPNECGGFLVGYYSDDLMTLHVTNFIIPNAQKGSPTCFERSSEGLEETFHHLFSSKKQHYIGEWHTHPDGSTMYSQTDLNAMLEIENSEHVGIKNPILLILSIVSKGSYEFSVYIYDNKELFKYE